MLKPSTALTAALALLPLLAPPTARAENGALVPVQAAGEPDPSLSPQCRVPGSQLYTLAPLKGVKRALKEKRAVRALAIGSSSTFGVGASSALATYPARLEGELERMFPGAAIDILNLGINGERAAGQAARMREAVSEAKPDLVIWQVGTNDALARVDLDAMRNDIRETSAWLKSQRIDLVLVDLQFTPALAAIEHYANTVAAVAEAARQEGVPLVRRFDAMRYLARTAEVSGYLAQDSFHLNDLGYRCMAEHIARAIAVGLIQDEPPAAAAAREVSRLLP